MVLTAYSSADGARIFGEQHEQHTEREHNLRVPYRDNHDTDDMGICQGQQSVYERNRGRGDKAQKIAGINERRRSAVSNIHGRSSVGRVPYAVRGSALPETVYALRMRVRKIEMRLNTADIPKETAKTVTVMKTTARTGLKDSVFNPSCLSNCSIIRAWTRYAPKLYFDIFFIKKFSFSLSNFLYLNHVNTAAASNNTFTVKYS